MARKAKRVAHPCSTVTLPGLSYPSPYLFFKKDTCCQIITFKFYQILVENILGPLELTCAQRNNFFK